MLCMAGVKKMKRLIKAVVLGSLCLFTVSAGAAETLSWVGCGISKKAYVAELAKAFEEKTGVNIDIQGGGATKGIRNIASGESDIGGSCRHRLFGSEEEKNAKLVPVAWDALAVIVHPENPVKNITLANIRDIYTGKTTNWSDLGGPDAPIQLYVREGKLSGVGYTIRKLIFRNVKQDFSNVAQEFASSGPLEKAIEQDPLSIAITGISSARKRQVGIMSLEGKQPSYENIRAGDYLLYRPLYLAYNPDSPRKELINQFIKFAHGPEGKSIMRANGTVPYLEAAHLIMVKISQ